MSSDSVRFAFEAEWFDREASLSRKYFVFFWPSDNTLEMYDVKNRRTFLKRVEYPSVRLADLYLGATITVYARQLKIFAFGDEFTKTTLSKKCASACAVIASSAIGQTGQIIDGLCQAGFTLKELRTMRLSPQQSQQLSSVSGFSLSSDGPVVAIEVLHENAVDELAKFAASRRLSDSLLTCKSDQSSGEVQSFFFSPGASFASTAQFSDCAVVVVKPHAVQSGQAGLIVDAVQQAGFEVSAAELFRLDQQAAAEFLEVYKGVVPEYNALSKELASSACLVLEVRASSDCVGRARELVGPHDPEVAKALFPSSLRAQFGQDRVKNAIHCTDLQEDGVLESEFFFSILQER